MSRATQDRRSGRGDGGIGLADTLAGPETAKLLLYVEPEMRGMGIRSRLGGACVERARAIGHRKLELWTNSVLASARRICEAAGFALTEETPHRSFGRDLVGQVWTLDLGEA